MSATKTRVELSLDEIIKNNKIGQRAGRRNAPTGSRKPGLRRQGKGVLKARSIDTRRNISALKIVRQNRNQSNARSAVVNKAVTQRLVSKLVKKALKQVTARRPIIGMARNVRGRRGGIRDRGLARNPLNRVSQRSRAIGRRQQDLVRNTVASFISQSRRGGIRRRGNVVRHQQNPIAAQLNFLRRQQNQWPQTQAPRIYQQRRASARQRARVVFVQQRPQPVRRQQQQIIYVQQPRRQFSRGRGARRQQRSNTNPFYEPPNFLQRVPATIQAISVRGGRKFVQF